MLKQMRNKNVTKFILWAILILILPAFVLWGTGNLGRGEKKGPEYVGTAEDKRVSFEDFAQSITSIRCQLVLNYYNDSKALESFLKNKAFVGKLAWDRLIMLKKAQLAKLKVPDQEVVKFIRSHPLFLRNGVFEDRAYEYFLRNSLGMYPRTFEELVRENLMIQKLTDSITKNIEVTDEEISADYERDNSKFRISYILLPFSSFTDKVTVTEEEIRDFYEKHKEDLVVRTKDAESDKESAKKAASYDEIKPALKTYMAESKAKPLALASANKTYDRLSEMIANNKLSFEAAAAKLGLKAEESKAFGKSDYLEGIGEADWVTGMAARMKNGEVSKPAEARKGILIFRVTAIEPFNQETFKKEKADFAKKVLALKKSAYMEDCLRQYEKAALLNIDLNDYEKYYK